MLFLAEKCATSDASDWPAVVVTVATLALFAFVAWCVTR